MKKWIISVILLLLAALGFLAYSMGTANSSEAELACQNDISSAKTAAAYESSVVPVTAGVESSAETTGTELTADEQEVFNLINAERAANGLAPLVIDKDLENIARLKARDMVDKDYFSHQSETYGSPFDMMRSFGISYKIAGENIAGNSSNTEAVNTWMNSEEHKENILNNSYTYTGIAAVDGSIYGKIFVQEFVGK